MESPIGTGMKDYYKILGVDEDASTEEIRERWIKLSKYYHPDLKEGNGQDEKLKEINEAYQVLKDYPKRLDYDLQRAIKKSIYKKVRAGKRRMSFSQKIIFSAGLVVFFLGVAFIFFKSFRVPLQPKSELRFEISKILEKKPVRPVPMPMMKEEVKAIVKEELKEEVKKEAKGERKTGRSVFPPSSSPSPGEPKQKEEIVLQNGTKSEIPRQREKGSPKEVTPITPPSAEALKPDIAEKKEAPPEVVRVLSQEKAGMDSPRPIVTEPPPVQKPLPMQEPQPVQELKPVQAPENQFKAKVFSPLPPYLAEEEEVRQFLSSYIQRYIGKDINGFLSFFSSKALQNQKDDFEKIRSIYTEFFDQSDHLRYGLEGLKIEIYQNSVEVKARYRVYQKLKKRGKEKTWTGNIRWVLVKEEGVLQISLLDYQHEKSP